MIEKTCNFDISEPIRTVEINTLKIGSDKSFHFLKENKNTSKPLYVLELNIINPEESSHIVHDAYSTFFNNPINWVIEAQKSECDILGLKFNVNENGYDLEEAKKLLKSILPYITKPLMIRGVNNTEIDMKLIPELINVLDRECIIAFADEKTYKTLVPPIVAGNHVLVIRTPIDINLAKEMNILTSELGLDLNKILIDTDMGGLGYGLEYGYSIMERIKLAAFEGDTMLNMPIIAFAGEESLKTKEAKSNTFDGNWGNFKQRSIMFEISAAAAIAAAGANVIVLNHPQSIKTLKGL